MENLGCKCVSSYIMCAFKLAVEAFMQNRKNRRMDKKVCLPAEDSSQRYEWNGALIFFARTLHEDNSVVSNN